MVKYIFANLSESSGIEHELRDVKVPLLRGPARQLVHEPNQLVLEMVTYQPCQLYSKIPLFLLWS